MQPIPRDRTPDAAYAILKDGYTFIQRRCRRLGQDAFRTRVLGKPAVCIHGSEAARIFYDPRLQRHGAVPRRVVTTLFGKGAVHTLDGEAHQRRKAMFMSLMGPESLEALVDHMTARWRARIMDWAGRRESICLFEEAQQVLTEAACDWAGVPLRPSETPARARQLGAMVDAFGGLGPRLWRGKVARTRAQLWMGNLVAQTRLGQQRPDFRSPLHKLSHHREGEEDALLDLRTASVEMLNLLRPIAAIAWYVTFAAHALHRYPRCARRIEMQAPDTDGQDYAELMMQEIRRFYPFTPYLGATVRTPFTWQGHRFEPGTLVLLDVYGSLHDGREWQHPERFWPERFERYQPGAFDFFPQGGGDHLRGHRCAGEWITMHAVVLALHFLARCIRYEVVPGQDLSVSLRRMPTRPRDGMLIRDVRPTAALHGPVPQPPSRKARESAARDAVAGQPQLRLAVNRR